MCLDHPGLSLELCASLGLAASLGLDRPAVRGILGSPGHPDSGKVGLAIRHPRRGGRHVDLPSAFRGTPAVGYFTH